MIKFTRFTINYGTGQEICGLSWMFEETNA